MIKLAISGSRGKMGQRICNLAGLGRKFKVVALLEKSGHPDIGIKSGSILVSDDINNIKEADVLIEFSSPEATIEHLDACLKYKKPVVIGTTGLSLRQIGDIKKAAKKIPIIFSPNMSVGVNLLFKLVKEAAVKLSSEYNITITETHHIHKKDAPSGTAKQLAQVIEGSAKRDIKDIKSIREGEVVGDHEVCFESGEDVIRLSHSAKTRDIFAKGALIAAQFAINRKKGLFDMQDILDNKK